MLERRGRLAGRPLVVLLAIGVLAMTTALVLSACGSSDSSGSSESSASSGEGTTEEASGGGEATGDVSGKSVFVVSCAPSDPYCATYNTLLQEGLEAEGVSVNTVTNPKDSALEEQQLVQAISQQPDLIINLPTDSEAVAQGYTKAQQAGIPVISTVNPVSPQAAEVVTSQVYDNNQDMGKAAAENIQNGLKEAGVKSGNVIAITGNAASATTQERLTAFEEQMATTPEYKLVETQDGNWDPIQTQEIASQLFAANEGKGGIQAAYGMSGLQAEGIIRAAKQAGLPVGVAKKGLIVSGSNCGPVSVKSIAAGEMYGDASETPSGDVEAVLPYAFKLLAGESIPKVVKVPAEPITKANVEEWKEACTY